MRWKRRAVCGEVVLRKHNTQHLPKRGPLFGKIIFFGKVMKYRLEKVWGLLRGGWKGGQRDCQSGPAAHKRLKQPASMIFLESVTNAWALGTCSTYASTTVTQKDNQSLHTLPVARNWPQKPMKASMARRPFLSSRSFMAAYPGPLHDTAWLSEHSCNRSKTAAVNP